MTLPRLRNAKYRLITGYTTPGSGSSGGTGGGGTPPSTIKAPIRGLVARNLNDVQGRPSDLRGVCTTMLWSDLQTTNGGGINTSNASWTNLQSCLATGLPVRMRIFCGTDAPIWAKNLNGGPMSIIEPTGDPGVVETCGLWWKTSYLTAWEDFMTKMAILCESNPQIREVACHVATTNFAEPCQRGTTKIAATDGVNAGKTNVQVFTAAGLTGGTSTTINAEDKNALEYPFQISAGESRWENMGWKTTRFYMPFNPFQSWKANAASTFGYDLVGDPGGYTATLMALANSSLGDLIVFANNSWRVQVLGSKYPLMYSNLQSFRSRLRPFSMQTATPARLLTAYQLSVPGATSQTLALKAALDTAIGLFFDPGSDPNNYVLTPMTKVTASSVELPSGWSPMLSAGDCATYNAAMEAF